MTTLILLTPYVALALGAAMLARALHLYSEKRPQSAESNQRRLWFLFAATLSWPTLAQAASVDQIVGSERHGQPRLWRKLLLLEQAPARCHRFPERSLS